MDEEETKQGLVENALEPLAGGEQVHGQQVHDHAQQAHHRLGHHLQEESHCVHDGHLIGCGPVCPWASVAVRGRHGTFKSEKYL